MSETLHFAVSQLEIPKKRTESLNLLANYIKYVTCTLY